MYRRVRGDFCNCQHAAIAPHHVKIRSVLVAPDALMTLIMPCDKKNHDNSIAAGSIARRLRRAKRGENLSHRHFGLPTEAIARFPDPMSYPSA